MATVGEIVKKTTEFFKAKSETARLDSELLIANALGWDRMQVYMKHDVALTEEQLEKCRALVRRRSKGEPVAYILGEKGFYKHSFEVTAATLIPRPETEMLVVRGLEILAPRLLAKTVKRSAVQLEIAAAAERRAEAERAAALAEAAHMGVEAEEVTKAFEASNEAAESSVAETESSNARPKITIVDLGCGTGCIGLSIADEIKDRADVRLILSDVSLEAIAVAKRNAMKLGLDDVCEFIVADAGDLSRFEGLNGDVDLVVANPPYIDPSDTRVEENVRLFEPHGALFAGGPGESGLLEIRRWAIVAKALARTAEGSADAKTPQAGAALFEIGDGQGAAALEIFEEAGWDHVKLARDLSDRERLIEAR